MNPVLAALRGVSELLSQGGASFALVGGFAVAARAEPRFTRDVDLAVSVQADTEAEALVRRLRRLGRSPAWCIVIRRARALLIPSSAVL